MKIEFVDSILNTDDESYSQHLVIDGEVDLTTSLFYGELSINKPTIDKISQLTIKEISKYCESVNFILDQPLSLWLVRSNLFFFIEEIDDSGDTEYLKLNPPIFYIKMVADPRLWNKPYSIHEVYNIARDIINKDEDDQISIKASNNDNATIINFQIGIRNDDITLGEIYALAFEKYQTLSNKLLIALSNYSPHDIFVTQFNFPEEIKTACKQYLIYFGQFLADMGINANTSMKEDANKVLFTIIPEDGNEALDKIKEALEVYMNAPANPDIDNITSSSNNDVAILQWGANINHLRSQVMLAHAVIQMKDATIEALQLSNYRLKEELSTSRQVAETAQGFNEEKILSGTVAVKKYDGKYPHYAIKNFSEYTKMSKEEINRVIDRFTNKQIFKCDKKGKLINDIAGNLIKNNYDNL